MNMYEITARVNPLADQSGRVKATASVTIDNVLSISSFTVVEGRDGLFVGFPKTKDKDGNYHPVIEFIQDKDGKNTKESVQLINAIAQAVLDAYNSSSAY